MFRLEKFLKKQKEPIEKTDFLKEKVSEPVTLRKNITIQHAQKILEDGVLYDTSKSTKIILDDMQNSDRAYFLTSNGKFFSADENVDTGYSLCNDGKVYNVMVAYSNLRLEPKDKRRYIEMRKIFPRKQFLEGLHMQKVRIENPEGSDWLGTKYFIDGTEIKHVRSADFHVSPDEILTSAFEVMALPDIEMESLVRFDYTPQSVDDAVAVLRHELLAHGEIYNGFKASLKSALEKYNCCGLPFEPEEEIAGKMLDFLIGEEK